MGSQINRALSRNDRRRRLTQQQQKQAKQYAKVFNCSMIVILIFGNAFMTSHLTQTHQNCLEYIIIAFIGSVIMNSSNPQILLVCGWLMVMMQTLFMGEKVSLLFNIGTFLTLYSIFTNMYNYFAFLHPIHKFVKNLIPSVLIIMGGLVYQFGHCSSHLTKQIRAQQRKVQVYQQHGIGIRIIFCILGIMIIFMSTIAHIYIKNRRFIPLSISQQLKFVKSIGIVPIIQIILFVAGIRSLMLNFVLKKQCKSGVSIVTNMLITAVLIGLYSFFFYNYLKKLNQPRESYTIPNLTSFILIGIYALLQFLDLSFYLTLPFYLFLTTMIITYTTNIIQDQLRVNYILAFITAIICQTNKLQHTHNKNFDDRDINILIYSICLPIAIGLPYAFNFIKMKFLSKQQIKHANPESSELIQMRI